MEKFRAEPLSESVPIRLTPTQVSVIWPGLDFIVKAESQRRTSGTATYCYPFRVYPPPGGFDRGVRYPEMMNVVIRLWRKLRSKKDHGGRVRLDSLELRCAIFAVRVTRGLGRILTRVLRKKIAQQKALMRKGLGPVDGRLRQELAAMKMSEERYLELRRETTLAREKEAKEIGERDRRHSGRTMRSLERYMKRSNRLLLTGLGKTEYDALVTMWQQHVRWMRLNRVYFKPLPPIVGSKRRQKKLLDLLTDMAIQGLKNDGYLPPEPRELRRVMRLYVRSSNRGREGLNSVPELLRYPNHFDNTSFLAQWVISRSDGKLERLS